MSDAVAYAGVLALALVLAVAALRGREIGWERGLKIVAAWLAIFIAAMLAFEWLVRPA